MDYEISPPGAGAMLESLRAYGYSLNSAIADIIDNSITAKAENIWIHLVWKGSDSYIHIRDDGYGMSENELSSAMVAGSQNPLLHRKSDDLGRFGLGLKTASLSQARSLTVATKCSGTEMAVRRWDLDYIAKSGADEWRLLKSCREGANILLEPLASMSSGTIVLLENLDKLCAGNTASNSIHRDNFYHRIDSLREHLAMVFQRFLSAPQRLNIFINGEQETHAVKPWDPFCKTHKATDPKPMISAPYNGKLVKVKGYILPHKDMFGAGELDAAAGPAGWNGQQGFYIYRNARLLVAGSWLGLRDGSQKWKAEEHYKLARIQVDITNDMDADWQIDVKKSVATPPHTVAEALVNYGGQIRKEAREVFAHRGKYGKRTSSAKISKIWMARQKNGLNTYYLNRSHPLLKRFLESAGSLKKDAETLFRLIEETVPVEQIWLDTAESPEKRSTPFFGVPEKEIISAAEQSLKIIAGKRWPPSKELIDMVCEIECFVDHRNLLYAHFGV
ncbi:ATP-binding protein [Microbulbifer sp. EKSA005]|uniref:ATP-binding protein n=1 Tax=Microbulbifer sp. EKSA005 TaxID=3243364 RepID=UPI0040415F49